MPHVDLTAAPAGAAPLPAAGLEGRSPDSTGFADALARAQSEAADAGSPDAGAPDTTGDSCACPMWTGTDAPLTAWLMVTRLAQPTGGQASPPRPPTAGKTPATGETTEELAPEFPSGAPPLDALLVPVTVPTPVMSRDLAVASRDVSIEALSAGTPAPENAATPAAGDGPPRDPALVDAEWPGDRLPGPRPLLGGSLPLVAATETSENPAVPASASSSQDRPAPAAGHTDAATSGPVVEPPLAPTTPAANSGQPPSGDDAPSDPTRRAGPKQATSAAKAVAIANTIAARFRAHDGTDLPLGPVARPDAGQAIEPRKGTPAVATVSRDAVTAPVAAPILTPLSAASVSRPPAVSAAAPTSMLDADNAEGLHGQIVQAMRLQWQGAGGDARIRLQPHYLGELTISLKVEHGAVVAHLAASQPEVRQWIEANEAMLRQSLAQHDLKLERLVVAEEESAGASDDEAHAERREQPRERPRRRRPGSDATFEVVV